MIFSKRKTIGVFVSKMFKVFDEAFFAALDREAGRLDYDMAVFVSAGYYQSTSDYDIQEKNIINFFPLGRQGSAGETEPGGKPGVLSEGQRRVYSYHTGPDEIH